MSEAFFLSIFNSMIVEFTGVPGIGKTYLAQSYCEYLSKKGVEYNWPYQYIYKKGYFMRNIIKLIFVLGKLVIAPQLLLTMYKTICLFHFSSWKDFVITLFNGFFLKCIIDRQKKNDAVLVLDEGVAQFTFSIYNKLGDKPQKRLIKQIMKQYGVPDIIYDIHANITTVINNIDCDRRKRRERNLQSIIRMKEQIEIIVDAFLDQNGVIVKKITNTKADEFNWDNYL